MNFLLLLVICNQVQDLGFCDANTNLCTRKYLKAFNITYQTHFMSLKQLGDWIYPKFIQIICSFLWIHELFVKIICAFSVQTNEDSRLQTSSLLTIKIKGVHIKLSENNWELQHIAGVHVTQKPVTFGFCPHPSSTFCFCVRMPSL